MQIPFFRERGLDLAGFHPGTMNVDCAPLRFRPGLGAALAARDGVALADLDPRRLAAALRDRGVNLDPELLR